MKKELTKAVPTVDADEKVIQWELEITYSKNDFIVPFPIVIETKPKQKPNKYSKEELLELANEKHWDAVFTSMYESTHTEIKENKKIDNFDLKSLS